MMWFLVGSAIAFVTTSATAQAPGKPTFLEGHTEIVVRVKFSPDGKTLASSSSDDTIRLWDVEKLKETGKLEGHTDNTVGLAFSPDGRILASSSLDKTIRLWDLEKKKRIRTLRGHKDGVIALSASPDGKLLASASLDATVRIWKVRSGKLIETILKPDAKPRDVAFGPKGKYRAIGEMYGVELTDLTTGESLLSPLVYGGQTAAMAFSQVGTILAAADEAFGVHFCRLPEDAPGNMARRTKTWAIAREGVIDLAFSPDGKWIYASTGRQLGAPGRIVTWNLKTREKHEIFFDESPLIAGIDISPDGKTLAAARTDNRVMLLKLEDRKKN